MLFQNIILKGDVILHVIFKSNYFKLQFKFAFPMICFCNIFFKVIFKQKKCYLSAQEITSKYSSSDFSLVLCFRIIFLKIIIFKNSNIILCNYFKIIAIEYIFQNIYLRDNVILHIYFEIIISEFN